jgi:hypothetical protein
LKFLERSSIADLSGGGKAGVMDELGRHPLTVMFSFIMSPNFIGLDIGVIETVAAFEQNISIAFMAKILYVMIRTGK